MAISYAVQSREDSFTTEYTFRFNEIESWCQSVIVSVSVLVMSGEEYPSVTKETLASGKLLVVAFSLHLSHVKQETG